MNRFRLSQGFCQQRGNIYRASTPFIQLGTAGSQLEGDWNSDQFEAVLTADTGYCSTTNLDILSHKIAQ
jgi:hypothetical protein